MGGNPVTDILHTQSGNHILTFHLQQETLSLVVHVNKNNEPQNTDAGKHPQVKRLIQRQYFYSSFAGIKFSASSAWCPDCISDQFQLYAI